jgi:hypothetical protein
MLPKFIMCGVTYTEVSPKRLFQTNSHKFIYMCSSSVLTEFQKASHSDVYDFFPVSLIFTFLEILIISLCSEITVMFRNSSSIAEIFLLLL